MSGVSLQGDASRVLARVPAVAEPGKCPQCQKTLAAIWGNGWDYDFIFCSCGFEQRLETSTEFDYSE